MLRIAIGQLWQETNTLNPQPTTRADFEAFGVLRGGAIIEQLAETNELGGFIQSLQSWPVPVEIVGLARLPAWPSGLATAETFDWLHEEFLAALRAALPVDGVLLALHGAMAAEDHPDVEGEVLAAVRQLVGPETPLVATLDLHANVTRAMVRAADALVLYHSAPHIDVFETGERGAALLRKILLAGARPTMSLLKLPLVPPAERANTQCEGSASWQLKRRLIELESDRRLLAAGVATVQPWLDVPELGSAVVVVANNDSASARQHCLEVGQWLWDRREDYLPELTPYRDAVRQAHDQPHGLTVISDAADATTSGAPGDSTWLLGEAMRYSWRAPALLTLVSPELVLRAHKLGVGGRYQGAIGGARDHRFSQPLILQADVERLFDAQFTLSGHIGRNLAIDMGRCAVLRAAGNVRLVVTSRSGPHFAPELFRAAGYEPFDAALVVAKSPCGFRAAYEGRAARIVGALSPGCAPPDFWNYPYQHRPELLWPWRRDLSWQAQLDDTICGRDKEL